MRSYLIDSVSVRRVYLKDLRDKVAAIGRQKLWDFEVTRKNFLVKVGRLWVFKWQESTHHRVEHNAAAPDVSQQSPVLFACYHFRRSVAWRPAGCFELAIRWVVDVAEPEVDNLQRFVEIKQEIFRFQVPVANSAFVDVLDARD